MLSALFVHSGIEQPHRHPVVFYRIKALPYLDRHALPFLSSPSFASRNGHKNRRGQHGREQAHNRRRRGLRLRAGNTISEMSGLVNHRDDLPSAT
jgi:hypothetical protein